MRIGVSRGLFAVTLILGLTVGLFAAQFAGGVGPNKYVVESKGEWGGPIEGPWEFTKEVVVRAGGLTLTCDRLKVWPSKDQRELERVEATGHIVIRGRYVTADGIPWQVEGKAESAGYDRKGGSASLQGAVSFAAVNLNTGNPLSVQAKKLVYDLNSRKFRFEGNGEAVKVTWSDTETTPAQMDAKGKESE